MSCLYPVQVYYRSTKEQAAIMAKVKNNKFTTGLSGKFGNIVFRQMKDGTTVVAAAPDFTDREFSEAQLATQSRFQQASAYARVAARENPLYAQLAAGTSKNAYNLALSDWYHSPDIQQVTMQEGRIHVEATDNVLVSNVRLSISDEQGAPSSRARQHVSLKTCGNTGPRQLETSWSKPSTWRGMERKLMSLRAGRRGRKLPA